MSVYESGMRVLAKNLVRQVATGLALFSGGLLVSGIYFGYVSGSMVLVLTVSILFAEFADKAE